MSSQCSANVASNPVHTRRDQFATDHHSRHRGDGAAAVSVAVAVAATGAEHLHGGLLFKPNKAGSKHKPVPVGFTETLTAANNTPGLRAAPLTDIKTSIYGLVSNAKRLPHLQRGQDDAAQSGQLCPKGALVATGPVNSKVGDTTLNGQGSPCNPFLHVWNGGHGTLWFFFTTGDTHRALRPEDRRDGRVSPATSRSTASTWSPTCRCRRTSRRTFANIGLYGSLIKEVLTFKNLKTKVHHKTVGINSSIGCLKGKRPMTVRYTATTPSGPQSATVNGQHQVLS